MTGVKTEIETEDDDGAEAAVLNTAGPRVAGTKRIRGDARSSNVHGVVNAQQVPVARQAKWETFVRDPSVNLACLSNEDATTDRPGQVGSSASIFKMK